MEDTGIRFSRDYGLITVSAHILGKKAIRKLIMVVDTGAYLTLIKPEVAELLAYTEKDSTGKFMVSSPIGKEKGYKIQVKRFEMGNHYQEDFNVGIIPIHESYGIDGLVGLNFFEHYRVTIDFPSMIMYLK